MSRIIGPKNKQARRVGTDLGLTTSTAKLQRRLTIPPGSHGRKGRRKISDYGQRLIEKQKLRLTFGLPERQLRRYYDQATKTPQATGEVMLKLLERRLDNSVYRLNFTPTRAAARQLVTHGHILVNGRKLSIPSYQVKVGDTIALSPVAQAIPTVKALLELKQPQVADWFTRKAAVGKVNRLPERADLQLDVNEQLIVEFYSR